ncbi:phage baseplate assembly protein V [Robbsia andropogonis]|uniref:phage baseplate assembly protein V n=1 Tax=Robbsia andropogonis TaxID=28092 RepID=UPI003D207946
MNAISLLGRIRNVISRGRISYVDDSGPVQRVQIKVNGLDILPDRLRVMDFGFSSNPPIGTDAVVAHIAGERLDGAVVGTNHQQSRPTGLLPGESVVYSEDGKRIYITQGGGIVIDAKGQDVVVNDAANVTWTCSGDFTLNVGGKFKVVAPGGSDFDTPVLGSTGDVLDNSGTNSSTSKSMRATFNTHTHPVKEVMTGSATVASDPPNEDM